MSEEKKKKIQDTIHILMQLDEKSLLLVDSGARLLAARQGMGQEATGSTRERVEV